MTALTIKNIPDELYCELKRVAQQRHRSINNEVIVCLKRALFPENVLPQQRLQDIRALRDSIPVGGIRDADLDRAIDAGRMAVQKLKWETVKF